MNSRLTLLHSEQPKLYRVLAVLSAIGLIISLSYVYPDIGMVVGVVITCESFNTKFFM